MKYKSMCSGKNKLYYSVFKCYFIFFVKKAKKRKVVKKGEQKFFSFIITVLNILLFKKPHFPEKV